MERRINTAGNSPVEDETPNQQLSENILDQYLLSRREMCAFDRNQSSKSTVDSLHIKFFGQNLTPIPKAAGFTFTDLRREFNSGIQQL